MKQYIPLTNDLLFKEIYGSKKNRIYLEDFLEGFMNLKRGSLHNQVKVYQEKILSKSKYLDKTLKCDLVVKVFQYIINIEVYQIFNQSSVLKSEMYLTRLHGTQLNIGEKYHRGKIFIQLNLIEKTSQIREQGVIQKYELQNTKTQNNLPFGQDIKLYTFSLDKIDLDTYNVGINDILLKHLKMIHAKSREERKKIAKGDQILMSLDEAIEQFINDEETKRLFDRDVWKARIEREEGLIAGEKKGIEEGKEQGIKEGVKQGVKKGIEEGIVKGKESQTIEIAKNMLKENLDISLIEKTTGLSKMKILSLPKEMEAKNI